ncbi:hypothetical protein Q7P36_007844 [Cladosporium allicinum]
MLLKRKRSANILSSPTTTSSDSSSVQAFYPHSKPAATTSPFDPPSKSLSFDCETPSHLNIRTRKRHRDNRPEASAVHGVSSSSSSCNTAASCWLGAVINMSALADVSRVAASTIQRLYQAQQQQQQHDQQSQQHLHQQQEPPQHEHQQPLLAPQKSTLHAFWHISQPPQPDPHPNTLATALSPPTPRCEDCDGSLQSEDAMEVDDGSSAEDKACGSCRRPVCDDCAVFGRERVCAGCAGCERGW